MTKYNQIAVQVRNDNEADVYLNLPHFRFPKLLGTLYRDSKTFRTIQRTSENLLHRLRECPQLGINVEVLTRLNFEFIEIPFNGKALRTTRKHFIQNSIPSPFVSEKVDPQRVLPFDQFIIPQETKQPELTLFELKETI
jgi:hypothetical protein